MKLLPDCRNGLQLWSNQISCQFKGHDRYSGLQELQFSVAHLLILVAEVVGCLQGLKDAVGSHQAVAQDLIPPGTRHQDDIRVPCATPHIKVSSGSLHSWLHCFRCELLRASQALCMLPLLIHKSPAVLGGRPYDGQSVRSRHATPPKRRLYMHLLCALLPTLSPNT